MAVATSWHLDATGTRRRPSLGLVMGPDLAGITANLVRNILENRLSGAVRGSDDRIEDC